MIFLALLLQSIPCSLADECIAYEQLEDVEGTLECLEKKATIFRYRREDLLAAEMDRMYDAIADAAVERDNKSKSFECSTI